MPHNSTTSEGKKKKKDDFSVSLNSSGDIKPCRIRVTLCQCVKMCPIGSNIAANETWRGSIYWRCKLTWDAQWFLKKKMNLFSRFGMNFKKGGKKITPRCLRYWHRKGVVLLKALHAESIGKLTRQTAIFVNMTYFTECLWFQGIVRAVARALARSLCRWLQWFSC